METVERYEDASSAHPLKLFDIAKKQGRFLYASAPMVRYSKLAFRRTVYHYGTDLCWTPMIVAKEFNRHNVARDSDFSISTLGPVPPTIAQFGANSPLELSRASSLVAPHVNGVDLNCGCPQSWACAEMLGAALMHERALVRDMVVATRAALRMDGWDVGMDEAVERPGGKGRSVSVKIRVNADLRETVDFLETLVPSRETRLVDWVTIHPRTRATPSTQPINLEALRLLTDMFGDKVPILLSGDVFALSELPFGSPLATDAATLTTKPDPGRAAATTAPNGHGGVVSSSASASAPPPNPLRLPKLRGLMAARAILANPALFAGHGTCPWEAVERFMSEAARSPLPLKLVTHHVVEMCGPGYGSEKSALLGKKEKQALAAMDNMLDLVDFLDAKVDEVRGGGGGMRRFGWDGKEMV